MNITERRAVTIFASFHPDGFIREKAVHMMKDLDGTLPYIILRQNDWVLQVRQTASTAFTYRLQHLSKGEILAAVPFAEKLKRSGRGSHGKHINQFFLILTTPEHRQDLMRGLENVNVRTRKICTEALFSASPPKIKLAFERLTCEPEPFLRATIFRKLTSLGQKMDEVIDVFLSDKYPVNRMLALQYLLDMNAGDIRETTERFLLDKNAAVRKVAQNTIQKQTPDYNFRSFYINNLERHPAAAIWGLGEKGLPNDTVKISDYLNDARAEVIKATIISLMRLDNEKYSPTITEMLDDCRAGVVKTARNLILKNGQPDYERVKEIFSETKFINTKLKCMDILFAAPKWPRLIYMLETMHESEEAIREKALDAIKCWLFRFNRSYTLPSEIQVNIIRQLIHELNEVLLPDIQKELLFTLSF
jgi:hypothetical protein